jgi:hypothetical protein
LEIIELMIERFPEALIMQTNNEGDTPLHLACRSDEPLPQVIGLLARQCPEVIGILNDFGSTQHDAVISTIDRSSSRSPTRGGRYSMVPAIITHLWRCFVLLPSPGPSLLSSYTDATTLPMTLPFETKERVKCLDTC